MAHARFLRSALMVSSTNVSTGKTPIRFHSSSMTMCFGMPRFALSRMMFWHNIKIQPI